MGDSLEQPAKMPRLHLHRPCPPHNYQGPATATSLSAYPLGPPCKQHHDPNYSQQPSLPSWQAGSVAGMDGAGVQERTCMPLGKPCLAAKPGGPGKGRNHISDSMQKMLPFLITPDSSVASDNTDGPRPAVPDNPSTMICSVQWNHDSQRVPGWWSKNEHTALALERLNLPETIFKEEPAKKVDRATTRQINDRLGLDPEVRRQMQTERNRQTARAAATRRRQAVESLKEMVCILPH
jgi:hypothetical protein